MEKKVKLNKKQIDLVTFLHNGQTITVDPVISSQTRLKALSLYRQYFFEAESIEEALVLAENALVLVILDDQTDIIVPEVEEELLDIDNIVASGLFDEICSNLKNFHELLVNIDKMVKYVREDIAVSKSIGSVLDEVASKLIDFANKLPDNGMMTPDFQKGVGEFAEQVSKLETILKPKPQRKSKKQA